MTQVPPSHSLVDLIVGLIFDDPDDAVGALADICLNHAGVIDGFTILGDSPHRNEELETTDVRVVMVVEHCADVGSVIEDILEGVEVATWDFYEGADPIELGEEVDNYAAAIDGYLQDHPTRVEDEEEEESD